MNLEVFEHNIQAVQEYLDNWLEKASQLEPQSDIAVEPIEELSMSFEELVVSLEELHQQQAELQAAHQAIVREKQLYQQLFNLASDGYLITNLQGIIQEANYAAAAMLNRDQERLVGKPMILFISSLDRLAFYNLLEKVKQAKQIQELEVYLLPLKQSQFPVTISVANVNHEQPALHWALRKQTVPQKALANAQPKELLLENTAEPQSSPISPSSNSFSASNQLLRALPGSEYQRLVADMEIVNLSSGQVLFQPGESITEVYFPEQAIISLAVGISDRSTSAIALVGNQGMVDLSTLLGDQTTNYGIVQIPGSAIKLPADVIKREFEYGGVLQKLLLSYIQTQLSQISQLAACKTHHSIEQQFAHWLLLMDDCLQQTTLPLTHKAIAKMMGVRRASITTTAQTLQKAKLISYSRGNITICDRSALEAMACECYGKIKSNFTRLSKAEGKS